MVYLRIRNGYGYICEKRKVDGRWKEVTLMSIGKMASKEEEKRWKWIKEHGDKLEIGKNIMEKDFDHLVNELSIAINQGERNQREIEDIWVLYASDNEQSMLIKTTSGHHYEFSGELGIEIRDKEGKNV